MVSALPLLIFALACDDILSDEPVVERFSSFPLTGGGPFTIDVDVFNGSVEVNGENTTVIEVSATIKRADKVDYSVEQFGSSVQVSASRLGSATLNSPSVNVVINAPSEATLIIRTSNGAVELNEFTAGAVVRTSNGRITVNGLSGDLEAETSNGSIEVSGFAGSAELETSNGSVRLTGTLVAGSDNGISTSNGSVTVDLPDDASLDLDASTSNGSVSSDFPITVSSSGSNHLEGVIGDGLASLRIRSSNGSISIK